MHFPRWAKISIAVVVVIVGGYLVSKLNLSSATVPADFSDARFQGALIAQDIVNLSNQVSSDLSKVQSLDSNDKTDEALNLTADLLKKSAEVRTRAVELSQQLEKMTSSLSGVRSQDARAAALESIADRLALINRLINYSDYLARLLNTLREKFAGVKQDAQISGLVAQINAEVTAINNFNRQAGQAMDRFDSIIRK
jgi:hypothetical protein